VVLLHLVGRRPRPLLRPQPARLAHVAGVEPHHRLRPVRQHYRLRNSRLRLEPWPTFRLFVTPFCVSSFAALVKGQGFILIFSPKWRENALAVGFARCWACWFSAARAATPVTQ
jgi:hypothetical protein